MHYVLFVMPKDMFSEPEIGQLAVHSVHGLDKFPERTEAVISYRIQGSFLHESDIRFR